MNTQEKSLALAELMGWEVRTLTDGSYELSRYGSMSNEELLPYDDDQEGQAQFAAILLKYPDVMKYVCYAGYDGGYDVRFELGFKPTQANILDEILRMEGKL